MEPQKCEVFALQGEIVLGGEAVPGAAVDAFEMCAKKKMDTDQNARWAYRKA